MNLLYKDKLQIFPQLVGQLFSVPYLMRKFYETYKDLSNLPTALAKLPSSKDSGNKINTITKVLEKEVYIDLINQILNNDELMI